MAATFNTTEGILLAFREREPAAELLQHRATFQQSLRSIAGRVNKNQSPGLMDAMDKLSQTISGNGKRTFSTSNFAQVDARDRENCRLLVTAITTYRQRLQAVQLLLNELNVYTNKQLEYLDQAENAIYPNLPCAPTRVQWCIMDAIEEAVRNDDHEAITHLASRLSE